MINAVPAPLPQQSAEVWTASLGIADHALVRQIRDLQPEGSRHVLLAYLGDRPVALLADAGPRPVLIGFCSEEDVRHFATAAFGEVPASRLERSSQRLEALPR